MLDYYTACLSISLCLRYSWDLIIKLFKLIPSVIKIKSRVEQSCPGMHGVGMAQWD